VQTGSVHAGASFPIGRVRAGFTLVEIIIVVVIIGLLAGLALPAMQRVRRSAQNSRFASDLRVFSQAFETYAMENGAWPANAGSGMVPAGLSDQISRTWTATNSLGGRWNWDANRLGIVAGISTTGVTADAAQMADLDARIDDGDLGTGRFRDISGRYVFVLEE
jgi:type IV pilus assembly protein PilA